LKPCSGDPTGIILIEVDDTYLLLWFEVWYYRLFCMVVINLATLMVAIAQAQRWGSTHKLNAGAQRTSSTV
jgi:hypothetical protein